MQYNPNNLNFAKTMRSNMTKEELVMWQYLRAHRFLGYKFKRQVLIGDYIVDFLCPDKKLIIELDGGQHNEPNNIINDKKRTIYLENNGYTVLRFWNNEVNNNLNGVLELIKTNLEQ